MNNDFQLLKEMLNATEKCLTLSEKINSVFDLKNNEFFYDNIISNLTLIDDIYKKLSDETKKKLNVNWWKFDFYGKELLNVKEKLDLTLIFKILKDELPILKQKLNSFLNES